MFSAALITAPAVTRWWRSIKMAGNPRPSFFRWFCAEKNLFEKQVTDTLQNGQDIKSGQHVIGHNADTAGERFAFVDRKWFYNIENPKEKKRGDIKTRLPGQKPEADQLAGHFIDDALARILFLIMLFTNCGSRDADGVDKRRDQGQEHKGQRR